VYELIGTTLRIRFKALESALIDEPPVPRRQNDAVEDMLTDKVAEALKKNPKITQEELVEQLGIPRRTLQRKVNELKEKGKIIRKGGMRYGYWEVN
jgi:ATP-dependent DNA helicase RecG